MCVSSIDKRVIDLLQDFLQIDFADVSKDTLLPELDSITFIELVVKTEMEFDIELYDEELLYDSNITIQSWIDIVQNHLNDSKENSDSLNPFLV